MDESTPAVADPKLFSLIRQLRGVQALMDSDLAGLYGVLTGELVRAVRRHPERFPPDFMFQLTWEEWDALRSQIGTSTTGRGGRHSRPYVFTEEGVAMLSSVLNSPRAIEVNIAIMRAFVAMRRLAATHVELAARLDELEARYDDQFGAVFDAIRELMTPQPTEPSRRIGFIIPEERSA